MKRDPQQQPGTTDRSIDLQIDFVAGAVGHRLRQGGGRGQDIAKAVGLKNGRNPHVVDATAGLGRDGFLLASLGATVTLIERSAKVHDQLAAALERARGFNETYAQIISRMTLLQGDARALLGPLDPQVVLVDPMHPPRGNSALVKKQMRILREIVGSDADSTQLIKSALAAARERVVLKWPRKAALPAGLPPPSHQIIGKSTRYDVFMK